MRCFKVGQAFVSKNCEILHKPKSTGSKCSNGGELNSEALQWECLGNEHERFVFKAI